MNRQSNGILPTREEIIKLLEEENQELRSRILIVESKVSRMEAEMERLRDDVLVTKRNE